MLKEVRTRYAPSPTGYMHIGNLRSAIFEYLAARAKGGKFILRIEDTDQARLVEGAVDVIYNTLAAIGITHDEGPDVGGDYGPYVQSERKHLYLPYALELVEKGHAYHCFCKKDRLDALREEAQSAGKQFKYDRHCLNLSSEEVQEKLASGNEFVIRQLMPDTGTTTYYDEVFGNLTFDNSTLEDQILIKSDGFPTYNFANVIDDHTMNITHILRGSEYLSSTPKFVHLYNAFGWDIPTFVHLPLVVKSDGSKISKRNGDAMFQDMIDAGYLPEAILNYTVLLGWSPGDEREFFTLQELEQVFDIKGISKSPSTLDYNKLKWMNGEYIRKLDLEGFTRIAAPWIKDGIGNLELDYGKIAAMIQKRTNLLGDIPDSVSFLKEINSIDPELYNHKKMQCDPLAALDLLPEAYKTLEAITEWEHNAIYDTLSAKALELGIKNGKIMWPVRVALTSRPVTPGGAIEIAEILGKKETLDRINIAIKQLEELNG
ncbi:MAG: glutamate--tRNA ligase [Clostridia bacterium]|nr:glutamate--tRNA ligase [Clostridia bacterium]MBN2884194.1 glutamate--tRNA ligase [Clostridia bacterium]